jgi:hypothetical protein
VFLVGKGRLESAAARWRELQGVVFAIGLALCLLLMPLQLQGQGSTTVEYRAKANFLSNFPNFVEWPADAFSSAQAPFMICVFGDFSFGTSLAQDTRGNTVHGRSVEIRWARKEQELRSCQILFVSHADSKRYVKVLEAVRGANILTVGETPDFLEAGGAVTFFFQQDALQFEVNLAAAEGAHLKMSSRLLALARRVVNKAAEAKS